MRGVMLAEGNSGAESGSSGGLADGNKNDIILNNASCRVLMH